MNSSMTRKENTRLRLPRWDQLPKMELYMDQLLSYMAPFTEDFEDSGHRLTSTMVNSYVKIGLLPAPVKRRYNKDSLARLFVIVTLKPLFNVSEIAQLIDAALEQHEIGASYDAFCTLMEKAFNSADTGNISHSGETDEVKKIIEDVCIAAAYQHSVKRRLQRRKKEQNG